jgi:glycosyltransferase involved in cell wall biosynthesis
LSEFRHEALEADMAVVVMPDSPLLSYIVLSYNYERYIRTTLESILAQSVQDFEVVVVDDASTDKSVEVISTFEDPRIHLLRNEVNMGGAASYNRAVGAARGEWLVNLDADDWVAPTKAERQLGAVRKDPRLDVLGTYVSVRDENGAPHTSTAVGSAVQSMINVPRDLNRTDSWIGTNYLCRSSTMVRASAHRRIGLDDPDMVRAPDYELWTRGLAGGLRMAVLPEELTFMRVHAGQVTHGDALGTFLEMTFAALRNLLPRCERLALYSSYAAIVAWAAENPALPWLPPARAFRLMGMLLEGTPVSTFRDFKALLESTEDRPYLADLGRRTLSLLGHGESVRSGLERYLVSVIEARDYWHEGRNHWKSQSEMWEAKYRRDPARRVSLRAVKAFVAERLWRDASRSDRA